MFTLNLLLILLQLYPFNLAAPLSTAPSLKSLNSESLNLALPTNLSLHDQPILRYLPSDPFSYNFPDFAVTIVFRNYTIAISRPDSERCVGAALADLMVYRDRLLDKINTPQEYAWGTVELTIFPEASMRWIEWAYAVQSIRRWLLAYDSVDMDFDVVVSETRVLGTGRLASVLYDFEGKT